MTNVIRQDNNCN